jgi:hypothetical protein
MTTREKLEGRLEAAKVNGGAAAAQPRGDGRYAVTGRAGDRYTAHVLSLDAIRCDCKAGQFGNACWHAAGRLPARDRRSLGGGMRSKPFTYRDHLVEPTALRSRSGYPLYRISGPIVNENVAVGNERLRIDGGYLRAATAARYVAEQAAKAAAS